MASPTHPTSSSLDSEVELDDAVLAGVVGGAQANRTQETSEEQQAMNAIAAATPEAATVQARGEGAETAVTRELSTLDVATRAERTALAAAQGNLIDAKAELKADQTQL